MDEILNVIVPSILINVKDYYIKGGRCYDFFFKIQIVKTGIL